MDHRKLLTEHRAILQKEMSIASRMYSKEDKVALLTRWRQDYSPTMVDELVRVAKHPKARDKIAAWVVDGFEQQRRKTK
jgi:hypothetical protein